MTSEKILKMQNKAFIKEYFVSLQGEGPYVGCNQLFVRFSNCNLKCNYCDTDFKSNLREFTVEELANLINNTNNIHSVSLTGGEPLLDVDFLNKVLQKTNKKIYLETNGTLFENLEKIINLVDIISMDIKLNSTTKMGDLFDKHEKFVEVANKANKELFIKIVFDENITDKEIESSINIAKKHKTLIILQPKMDGMKLNLSADFIQKIYNKFIEKYDNVRLIPQVHKFINVE